MVTLSAPRREATHTHAYKHTYRRTGVNMHAVQYLISHFHANFFWLKQSSGPTLITADNVMLECMLAWQNVCLPRGPQWEAGIHTSITCWVFTFRVSLVCVCVCMCVVPMFVQCVCACFSESMCLTLDYICTSVFIRVLWVSVVPFTVYVSVPLCHPTLPIITHKKKTAHIPWDKCARTYGAQAK